MNKPSAPTPTVQHLPTLLRRVQSGDIVVPAFQRRLVWKPSQMLELLTSVYRGFPVGSILLWRVDDGVFSPDHLMGPPFPKVPLKPQRHYVLDGHQRLATLYGSMYGEHDPSSSFSIAFDLRNEVFDYENQMPDDGAWLLLADLFSPKNFLAKQRELSSLPDGDELIDRAISLHTAFQEYMIPLVTISDRSVEEVVQIFERINNTGTKLDAVDFLRAVTWSQGFDLNKQIRRLSRIAGMSNFSFHPETLTRVFAVVLGKDPTASDMLSLRTLKVKELRDGVVKTERVLHDSLTFLRSELHIRSADYLPYDAQLLVVARLFAASSGAPPAEARRHVANWLLASTLNEEFQGKADHRVARIVRSVEDLLHGRPHLIKSDLALTARALTERRLVSGKALSSGICLLLGMSAPRSLVTGKTIPLESFLSRADPEVFAPFLSRDELGKALHRAPSSTKVLANVIVCGDAAEARYVQSVGWGAVLTHLSETFGDAEATRILESQLISREAAAYLRSKSFERFLMRRATEILTFARRYTRDVA